MSVTVLEASIRRHCELYYNRAPTISDDDFDVLVEELRKLAPNSPVLRDVK